MSKCISILLAFNNWIEKSKSTDNDKKKKKSNVYIIWTLNGLIANINEKKNCDSCRER